MFSRGSARGDSEALRGHTTHCRGLLLTSQRDENWNKGDANLRSRLELYEQIQVKLSPTSDIHNRKSQNKCHFRPSVQQETPSLSSLFSSSVFQPHVPSHLPSWHRRTYQLHPKFSFVEYQISKKMPVLACIIALIIISASSFASAWKNSINF